MTYKKAQARAESAPGYSPMLRATNIQDGELVLDRDLVFIPDEVIGPDQRLRENDIVLAASSGSLSVVGKSARVREPWAGAFGAFCTVLRAAETADPRYIGYYVASRPVRQRWSQLAAGTNINNLKRSHIDETPIPLPPLAEQRRIVEVIGEQFSRVGSARTSLEHARVKILKLRRRTIESGLAGDWRWRKVGEVAEVQGGIQKQPKRRPVRNAYPFLRVANVMRNELDLSEVHQIEIFDGELDRYRLRDGDLLVVEGNGSIEQIGRSALWHGEIEDAVHQNHLIRVRPGSDVLPSFLNLYWNAPSTAERLASVASSTSGLYTLSTGKLKSLDVPVPPLEEQTRIVAEIEQQLSLADSMEVTVDTALRRADGLRLAILDRAFRGALVPQDPSDEPASVLLERIAQKRASDQPKRARKAASRRPRKG